MPRYDGARLKIDRAKKHIADIQKFIAALPDRYTATIEPNPQLGNPVIKHDLQGRDTIGTDLAVIIGDAIHNLHCALDYAWVETVTRLIPSANARTAKFPVYPTSDQLERVLTGRGIDVAARNLFNFIVAEVQPYNGGKYSIWPIHALDIDDKHRLLIPVLQMGAIADIELENEHGETERGFAWGTVQKPPYFVSIESGWHIKNKGNVTVAIIFDEATPLYGMDVADMLSTFAVFVFGIVERMENLF